MPGAALPGPRCRGRQETDHKQHPSGSMVDEIQTQLLAICNSFQTMVKPNTTRCGRFYTDRHHRSIKEHASPKYSYDILHTCSGYLLLLPTQYAFLFLCYWYLSFSWGILVHKIWWGLPLVPPEKAMATHSSILAWKIPWMEEPGRLQSMGSQRVRHHRVTSLSFFTSMHWRRKWQLTPVFLPGESQGWGSLVGCCLWGRTESDTTEAT